MIKIDRELVRGQFAAYVKNYNASDDKIRLKIVHTYHVAELCETIASSLTEDSSDVDLAWLLGMLHDIGRFEQLRRFGTFSDAESVDHAQLATEILFGGKHRILEYLPLSSGADDEIMTLIQTAIACHSVYRLPKELDFRTRMFCQILRDADKIDILRVNVDVPLEAIYNTTTQAVKTAEVTPEVMQAFAEEHAVLRSLKKTPVDHVVGHMALVFELVYPISIALVKEQGYLNRLMNFSSENEKTQEQFQILRAHMCEYLERKLQGGSL